MDKASLIQAKVNELVDLLRSNTLNDAEAQLIRQKINEALDTSSLPKKIEAFRGLDEGQDRLELLDDLELLLSQHQLDNKIARKYLYHERISKTVVMIIGIIMITLGMGMIIMPAPPYFEMFTIFYFTPTDGVTIMDVISLLIVFTGVYLLLNTFIKKPKT